ncbi:MAG: DUF1592 domain-containing protein [Polyangiales bacterium]
MALGACTGSIDGAAGANGAGTGVDPCSVPGANPSGCDLVRSLGDEVPAFVPLRRLSRQEYGIVMNELLGAPTNISEAFEADGQTDGFDTVGLSLPLSDTHARTHFRLAESSVAAALAGDKRSELLVCGDETATCARAIANAFARRAWRRPLTDEELDDLVEVYTSLRASELDHEEAIAGVLEAALGAPEFFLRIEEDSGFAGPRPLTSNEMLSRLSLFLWSSVPDDELLALAETDQLQDEDVLRTQVDRMLRHAKGQHFVENFSGQWLRTRELPGHSVSSELFPAFNDAVRASALEESRRMFSDVLLGDDPVGELLVADWGYVDSALAGIYGVDGKGFETRTTLGPDRALGVLSRVAFLTVSSMFDRTSVVRRGNRILSDVLCASPGPPNDANLELPPADPNENLSLRERLEQHRSQAECQGCHSLLDPLGFALENFDAIGRERGTYEDGADVVTSGVLPGFGPFEKGTDIGPSIAGDPRFQQCVARKLLIYGVGRNYVPDDAATLERVSPREPYEALGLREVVTRLVLSAAFRVRKDSP